MAIGEDATVQVTAAAPFFRLAEAIVEAVFLNSRLRLRLRLSLGLLSKTGWRVDEPIVDRLEAWKINGEHIPITRVQESRQIEADLN